MNDHDKRVDIILHELLDDKIYYVAKIKHKGANPKHYHFAVNSDNPGDELSTIVATVCKQNLDEMNNAFLFIEQIGVSLDAIDTRSICPMCTDWLFEHKHLIPDLHVHLEHTTRTGTGYNYSSLRVRLRR